MVKFEYSKERKNKKDSKGKYSKKDSNSGKTFEEFSKSGRGRKSSRNSRTRRDFVMTKVTCSSCGDDCEVPFKPTSNKPIFCSECFRKEDKSSSNKTSSKDLEMINKKLDKIMEALKIK